MLLETLVVVEEMVFVGMKTLLVEEISVVEVALGAVMVVVDTVDVGMVIMGLIIMEAILEVAEAMILPITTINIQILDL